MKIIICYLIQLEYFWDWSLNMSTLIKSLPFDNMNWTRLKYRYNCNKILFERKFLWSSSKGNNSMLATWKMCKQVVFHCWDIYLTEKWDIKSFPQYRVPVTHRLIRKTKLFILLKNACDVPMDITQFCQNKKLSIKWILTLGISNLLKRLIL